MKPMLAASCDDLNLLRYPLLATPKIDGIRCLIIDGVATSRTLKPIPNKFIQSIIGKPEFNGLDGELLVGNSFQQATSGIMTEKFEPDFTYYVFDDFSAASTGGYKARIAALLWRWHHFDKKAISRLALLAPISIANREELDLFMAKSLELGHEGTMVRSPEGPYKQGRATFNSGWLTKLKPFEDAEATVIGFEERQHNGNAAVTNLLGRTERSSHKAGMVAMGSLGALICSNQELWPGQTFNIGTGFNDFDRQKIWNEQEDYRGKSVKFKYQKIGSMDKPRIPVYLGFRQD